MITYQLRRNPVEPRVILSINIQHSTLSNLSRANRVSQRSLPSGSFTVRTSSPVIPVLGLLFGDWVPWANDRFRGDYVGKTVWEITEPTQKKDLLSALRFRNTVPATAMFRGLAGRSAEEVSKRRSLRVCSGAESCYERELNSRFRFCFLGNETLGSFGWFKQNVRPVGQRRVLRVAYILQESVCVRA